MNQMYEWMTHIVIFSAILIIGRWMIADIYMIFAHVIHHVASGIYELQFIRDYKVYTVSVSDSNSLE